MKPPWNRFRLLLFILLVSGLPHSTNGKVQDSKAPGFQGTEEEPSEYVVSECYGDIFNFDCGRGNKIRINKDFFGYSKEKTCRYSQGECIISNPKSNSLIHRFCTGHRVCTYYLVERRGCGGSFSNYQQVEYQCIPDAMVTDICGTVDYKASSTYIASPNFPENYPPKLNCRCVVSASTPKAKVRMEIVYLAIKYTTPCRDWLSIGSRRTCGTTMDLFQGRRIPIEFRSDQDDSHSGFWLHFKSSIPGDEVHVQCGNVTLRPPHRETTDGEIERKPRPEDVPEERTTTVKGPTVTVTESVKSSTVTAHHTQNDPAPTAAATSGVTGSTLPPSLEDTTDSVTNTVIEASRTTTAHDEQLQGEGKANEATLEGKADLDGGDIKGWTEMSTSLPEVTEGSAQPPSSTLSAQFPAPGADSNVISSEISTDSVDTGGSITDTGGDNTHNNISRLDDEESWLHPVSNDVVPPDNVMVDDHFRLDQNRNQSYAVNETLSRGGGGEGGEKAPVTTQRPRLPTLVPSIATAPKTDSFLKLGVIIISVSIGIGVLLVCIVLLIIFLRRHRTRDEETQTPRPKNGSDGDSGQGLLVSRHRPSHTTADKSLQIDLDSDVDVLPGGRVRCDVGDTDIDDFSTSSATSPYDPNCKGVQVTSNALAKAHFRFHHNRNRKRCKTLIGKSSSSGIDVKGCPDTTEGSSSGECGPPYLRAHRDLSDPGSYSCSEYETEEDGGDGLGHHHSSLASMSLYSEVTLMPESAVLPSENNDFYDSFSDPDWDQKSAISI